jgi:hypothetical protein
MTFQGIVLNIILFPQEKFHKLWQCFSITLVLAHKVVTFWLIMWHLQFKCFGTLRPRGNTKKPKTLDEMIARSKLKDSDYSDNGSDVTFSDRSLRCHKKRTQNKKSIR